MRGPRETQKRKHGWEMRDGTLLCLQQNHALGGVKSDCCIVCGRVYRFGEVSSREYG
jgi:hypothetical protein